MLVCLYVDYEIGSLVVSPESLAAVPKVELFAGRLTPPMMAAAGARCLRCRWGRERVFS